MWHLGPLTVSVACCSSCVWVMLSSFSVCVLVLLWKVEIWLIYFSNFETDSSFPSLIFVMLLFVNLMTWCIYFLLLCNKLSQTWGIKRKQIYYLSIRRSEVENDFSWAKIKVTTWLIFFWKLKRRICCLECYRF